MDLDILAAPLARHTGWSLRATGCGEGDLFTIQGAMIPFAATEAERQRAGDPRPSLETRYGSRDAWATRVAEATDRLFLDGASADIEKAVTPSEVKFAVDLSLSWREMNSNCRSPATLCGR
jgi:hypothetical protein